MARTAAEAMADCGTCGGSNSVDISSGNNGGIDNCDGNGNGDSGQ